MDTTPLGPGPLIYAHRGDRSRAEDNTLDAFSLAVEAGADGIELDVRRTADGVLVLSHDPTLASGITICDVDFEVLRASEPDVPTLVEAFRAVPHDVYLNVEIKNLAFEPGYDASGSLTRQVIDTIVAEDEPSRILLSSFDVSTVAAAEGSGLICGLLVENIMSVEDAVALTFELGVEAIHPPMGMMATDPGGAASVMHDAGLAIVVWDANTPDEVSAAAEAGCDVIITDDPTIARVVLAQR